MTSEAGKGNRESVACVLEASDEENTLGRRECSAGRVPLVGLGPRVRRGLNIGRWTRQRGGSY